MGLIRIECNCDICENDAARIGAPFPMQVDVPPVTAKKARNAKTRHALVHDAHNPGAIGSAMCHALGMVPVR